MIPVTKIMYEHKHEKGKSIAIGLFIISKNMPSNGDKRQDSIPEEFPYCACSY